MIQLAFSAVGATTEHLDGVASLFKSIAYLALALAAFTVAFGIGHALVHQRRVSAAIDSKLLHIDLAVNGVASDEPPLIHKVRHLQKGQRAVILTLNRICEHLGLEPHEEEGDPS